LDHVFGWEEFGGIAEGLEDGLEFFYGVGDGMCVFEFVLHHDS